MNFSNAALYAYYEKCGVSDDDAKLVASMFGDEFLDKQIHARNIGLGNLAKASAAQGIADGVLNFAHGEIWYPLPADLKGRENVIAAVRVVRAAGLCVVAISGYALQEDHSAQCTAAFARFLDSPKMTDLPFFSYRNHAADKRDFAESATRLAIESMALGRRKGFFSSFLG